MGSRIIRKVADKNAIRLHTDRGAPLRRFLQASPNHHLIVTTGNLLESTVNQTNTDPASNFIQDFQGLVKYSNQLYIIKDPASLNTHFNWVSAGLQQRLLSANESAGWHRELPSLIESMKAGNVSPVFKAKKQESENWLKSIEADSQEYLEFQRTIGQIPNVTSMDWDNFLTSGYLAETALALLLKATISYTHALHFASKTPLPEPLCNSIAFRYNLAYALLALERRARGKQINFQLSSVVIRNDAVDMLYVAQASYFDGFFCHEVTSRSVYRLMKSFFSSSHLSHAINRYTPDPALIGLVRL
ncbi:MAG: hypothetical protein OJI67_12710 [Prosthecobacter sp.]|nr:hypothetical protein [Prosthecobacter sp.]